MFSNFHSGEIKKNTARFSLISCVAARRRLGRDINHVNNYETLNLLWTDACKCSAPVLYIYVDREFTKKI